MLGADHRFDDITHPLAMPSLTVGDLYHNRDNFRHARIPAVNTSRAETLASFARIGELIEKYRARFVIQHAPEDFAALPAFPAYLD